MIEPTEKDIGRDVVYLKQVGDDVEREDGIIERITDEYIFVRYDKVKATYRKDLEWLNED